MVADVAVADVFLSDMLEMVELEIKTDLKKKYSNELLKELSSNINLIEGIEILIADSTYERIESAWGHAALRLLSRRKDLDFVVDFVPKENITIRQDHLSDGSKNFA